MAHPQLTFASLDFSAVQSGSGILGWQKTTLMEAVPPPHLALSKPGFEHTFLAFCHLCAPHFSLTASGRTSPCTHSCSGISLVCTLMDRYAEASGKCLLPLKHSSFVAISRKNKYARE